MIEKKKLKRTTQTPAEKVLRRYNLFKGRMGESLVKILFEEVGFTVFPYGIEVKLPEVVLVINQYIETTKKQGKAIKQLRKHPDFVVYGEQFGSFFIEAKFSSTGKFSRKSMLKYTFDGLKFLLITTDGIYCVCKDEIEDLPATIKPKEHCKPIQDHKDFNFTKEQKEILSLFGQYTDIFSGLPSNKEIKEKLETAL